MAVIVCLLRGVNVGGNHKMAMHELRACFETLGFRDVQTLIQSGNVIFRTASRDMAALTARIEDKIEGSFGFRPRVVLRTCSQLRNTIAVNPFTARDDIDPAKLLVMFLSEAPDTQTMEKVLAIQTGEESMRFCGGELFIYFPNGVGRALLPVAKIEKALKTPCTGRNWNTVVKLLGMAEETDNRNTQ